MEYERIHKVQSGLISPSKLRMKLMGSNLKKKEDTSSKKTNSSSRTSPSRLDDLEFVKNNLLMDDQNDVLEEDQVLDGSSKMQQRDCMPRENVDSKMLQSLRLDNVNADSLHPGRACDDENLDYDSTSSFEFHRERSHPQSHHVARSFTRPMPSKWNDAEKWIMNRQNVVPASSKKMHFHNQSNRVPMNTCRVVPEAANVKQVDFCIPAAHPTSVQGDEANGLVDLCPESKDLMEVESLFPSCNPGIRSVSMRDMGTEMTPIPSLEPSRTATPEGATTPLRSPTSSIPSTPGRGDPAPTPTASYIDNASHSFTEHGKMEMSDQDLKLKIRRDILALGVQLGKMNIAAWACKDEKDKASAVETDDHDELQQIEFAKRAAAWEEAEKSKHNARFKREELVIEAWESHQRAKLEADMRKIEAQVEKMRVQSQEKMMKKTAKARRKSEEKHVAAEARKNSRAQKVSARAEYIRQRGRLPSSSLICCGWS